MLQRLVALLLLLALTACAATDRTEPPTPRPVTTPVALGAATPLPDPNVYAWLVDAQNEFIGLVTLTEEADGVRIGVTVGNLTPGFHGWHIHEVGSCDPPDFASAGGHFNPLDKEHGLDNPMGPHAGDLPDLEVAPDGTAQLLVVTDRVSLRAGPHSLLDADGSSLIIHAKPDDQLTNPAGDSGERVACGTIGTQ